MCAVVAGGYDIFLTPRKETVQANYKKKDSNRNMEFTRPRVCPWLDGWKEWMDKEDIDRRGGRSVKERRGVKDGS